MPREIGPHLTVYHVYATKDSKDVGGTLGGSQPIVHKEVPNNPTHGNFHPAFYEGYHQNYYRAKRSVHDQPFA